MSSTIEVNNQAVLALLTQLQERTGNASPVLRAIGEDIVERTKQRFATATAPDGARWRPNTQATIINYLMRRSGNYASFSHVGTRKEGRTRVDDKKGYFKKDGSLTKKAQGLLINKRPLQGDSGSLADQIFSSVDGDGLTVSSSMRYAAMQQFGGTKSRFHQLWGDIPARPFFPVTSAGELYPNEESQIVERLRQYLGGT